jgi:hypothetical protein
VSDAAGETASHSTDWEQVRGHALFSSACITEMLVRDRSVQLDTTHEPILKGSHDERAPPTAISAASNNPATARADRLPLIGAQPGVAVVSRVAAPSE